MTAVQEPRTAVRTVTAEIDGHSVTVPEGTSIYDAAKRVGVDIPVLCHDPRLRPVEVCRVCVVDVGARVLAASCVRPCEPGMKVTTGSDNNGKNTQSPGRRGVQSNHPPMT